MTPLVKGVYIKEDPLTMDDPYLTGHCSETNTDFIFITKQGDYISSRNSVLFVPVVAYIDCKYARDSIARMSFSCPVINRIHPISQGIGISMDVENFVSTGVCSVTTESFDETTTVPQNFTVDDRQISVEFSISRILSTKIDEPPITLESAMLFEFEPTNDYHFIYKLWRVAKQFFQYLCYRKNVFLPETVLFAPADGGNLRHLQLYISIGAVMTEGTEHILDVCRGSRSDHLTGELATVWLNGRFGFATVKKPTEEQTLLLLLRMGLAIQTDGSGFEEYRALTQCTLVPADRKHPYWGLTGMERTVFQWLREAGLVLSMAELTYLIDQKSPPASRSAGQCQDAESGGADLHQRYHWRWHSGGSDGAFQCKGAGNKGCTPSAAQEAAGASVRGESS